MTILILTVSLILPGAGRMEPVTLQFKRPSMERCLADGEAMVRQDDEARHYTFECRAETAL